MTEEVTKTIRNNRQQLIQDSLTIDGIMIKLKERINNLRTALYA